MSTIAQATDGLAQARDDLDRAKRQFKNAQRALRAASDFLAVTQKALWRAELEHDAAAKRTANGR